MKFRNPVPSLNYQPHIDGLRALAIIPVFLYHLNSSYCSGGFGGVDIFFVISGYLISIGIFKKLDRGTFSLLDFYDKRIRRIIPIYTLTIFAVLLISIFILHPSKLRDLADLARYGTFFAANIKLNSLSQDYFSQDQSPNALTNLWSLSVEEQFYIFLPILLILTYKFSKNYLLHTLCFVFSISFGLTLYHFFTNTLENQAFYLLPFRMYELLIGSLLAYFTVRKSNKNNNTYKYKWNSKLHKLLALVGLIGVIAIYNLLNKTYIFPSLWAFALCVFSAILIKYGNLGITGKILESKSLVFIGRISYSIYLIHFPLIILYSYVKFDTLTILDEILITLITLVLSTFTWAFVELPIRLSTNWTRKKSFILWISTTLLIIAFVQVFYKTNSFREYIKISPYINLKGVQSSHVLIDKKPDYIENFSSYKNLKIYKLSNSKEDANILIYGDSHCQVLAVNLDEEFTKLNIAAKYISSSIPIVEYHKEESMILKSIIDYLDQNPKLNKLIIIHRWWKRGDNLNVIRKSSEYRNNPNLFYADLSIRFIDFLRKLKSRNIEVFVTSTVPEHLFDISEYGARKKFIPQDKKKLYFELSKEQYQRDHINTYKLFKSIEEENLAKIISLEKPLENNNGKSYRFENDDGILLYFDKDHLSQVGAKMVVPNLIEELLNFSEDDFQ